MKTGSRPVPPVPSWKVRQGIGVQAQIGGDETVEQGPSAHLCRATPHVADGERRHRQLVAMNEGGGHCFGQDETLSGQRHR
jgi:hypothetical protein